MAESKQTIIAAAWRKRARELAEKTLREWTIRTDVWGGYQAVKYRVEKVNPKTGRKSVEKNLTKPAVKDRGKKYLTIEVLEAHYRGHDEAHVAGLHTTSTDHQSVRFVIEVDAHEGQPCDPDANWELAQFWHQVLMSKGIENLLSDSNGKGGFHIQGCFDKPVPTAQLYEFLKWVVSQRTHPSVHAETFPKQERLKEQQKRCGNWIRLPGRHHTADHWTRVWDGEQWLEGEAAVEAILNLKPNPVALLPEPAPAPLVPPKPPAKRAEPRFSSGQMTEREIAVAALKCINNSGEGVHYETYRTVGMALHSVDNSHAMRDEWIAWARQSNKFQEGDAERRWESFTAGGGVQIPTLITMARESEPNFLKKGWRSNGQHKGNGRASAPRRSAPSEDEPVNQVDEALSIDEFADEDVDDVEVPPEPTPEKPKIRVGMLTDYGNAQRLVRRHGGDLRYDGTRAWWLTWGDHRWLKDETGEAMRRAKESARSMWREWSAEEPPRRDVLLKHAKKSEGKGALEAALRLAQSEPGIAISTADLDRDTMLFNVLNGTVDLRTGELRPHNRKDLITKIAPVAYDPNAKCPLWQAFLRRIMDGNEEMEGYLQRIAGLSLTGDTTVQEMWIYYGSGANGKSVYLDTFMGIMGEYAGSAADSLLTARTHDEHPTEIADLFGRRLVVGSETEEGAKLRIQLIKRLTGNKTLKARFMRQDFFEFERTHKLILVTNNKPQVKESTNAVWRRLRLVPFTVTIPAEERDPQLIDKLKAEWPGILAWAVRGCLDWQGHGMQTPHEVQVATAEYQMEQDVMAEFLAARCIRMEGVKVERTELFTTYQQWCKLSGEKEPLEKQAFYDRIRRVDGVTEGNARFSGQVKHAFMGIALCGSMAGAEV